MWEEYLSRLPDYQVKIKLLFPHRSANFSLRRLLQQEGRYELVPDYLYWPRRYFERVAVRSAILKSLYMDDSVDIFHSTYFSTVYDRRVRKVVTVHDMIPEVFQDTYKGRWAAWEISIKRKVLENADRIIADSHNTKQDLLRIYPWIPEAKVSVIYPGLSGLTQDTSVTFRDVAEKYSLSIQPREYLLFVGRRGGYKNFQLILDLLENSKSYRDLLFLCVGGENDARLSALLAEKGLSGNFVLLGYVQDHELAVLYRNALALVYPSRYEGLGLPVLEAMANECPVICSNTSCFPETAGEAAIYFDPYSVDSLKEAIAELLRQDRDAIIKKGLENVRRFSWEKSTKALVDIYASLM